MNPFDLALRRLDERLRPPRLPIGDVSYALHDTGLGQLVLAVAEPGTVVACSYDDEAAVTEHLARALSPVSFAGLTAWTPCAASSMSTWRGDAGA